MLCGKCKKPLLCKHCGETEYSQHVDDGQDCIYDACRCERFRYDDCKECAKITTYVGIDARWYIKSTIEVIQIGIFVICLIGFVVGFIAMWFNQKPWVSNTMGWSMGVGVVNVLFMVSADSRWRDDYEDRSMVFPIREKRNGI